MHSTMLVQLEQSSVKNWNILWMVVVFTSVPRTILSLFWLFEPADPKSKSTCDTWYAQGHNGYVQLQALSIDIAFESRLFKWAFFVVYEEPHQVCCAISRVIAKVLTMEFFQDLPFITGPDHATTRLFLFFSLSHCHPLFASTAHDKLLIPTINNENVFSISTLWILLSCM